MLHCAKHVAGSAQLKSVEECSNSILANAVDDVPMPNNIWAVAGTIRAAAGTKLGARLCKTCTAALFGRNKHERRALLVDIVEHPLHGMLAALHAPWQQSDACPQYDH